MSLNEKYGWKGILLKLLLISRGLFDPNWCKNNKWITVIAAIIKGNKKWNVKNRVRVALSTANPPQSHWTRLFPR